MSVDDEYDDQLAEEIFPWRDQTPEQFVAHNWLRFGACSISRYPFRNKELHRWVRRFEEILHDTALIEECRQTHLTPTERREQDAVLREIDKNGFQATDRCRSSSPGSTQRAACA